MALDSICSSNVIKECLVEPTLVLCALALSRASVSRIEFEFVQWRRIAPLRFRVEVRTVRFFTLTIYLDATFRSFKVLGMIL